MQPLEPDDPRAVGPYRLIGLLGSGGMGRVYLARSARGRTVAVKVVHPHFAADPKFRDRFRREVASASRVGTAAVPGGDARAGTSWTAPVLDADPDARVPWVATGFVAGPALHEAVEAHGALPEPSVRALGAGLAEALSHVHGLGLVHRDVKPSNVMLTLDGPRLIDFGIARAMDGSTVLTATGVSVGSPGYMSPEQVLGKGVSYPSDVFSLGAVLAYAATGRAPFPGNSSASLLYKVVHEEPELDGVHGPLRDLVAACLDKDAGRRPEPRALATALAGTPQGAGGVDWSAWLPAGIVAEVSRQAVALLDLEQPESEATRAVRAARRSAARRSPAPAAPAAPPAAAEPVDPGTGLVPFTRPSEGPVAAAGGAFGPPDPSYGAEPPEDRATVRVARRARGRGPAGNAPQGADAVPLRGPAPLRDAAPVHDAVRPRDAVPFGDAPPAPGAAPAREPEPAPGPEPVQDAVPVRDAVPAPRDATPPGAPAGTREAAPVRESEHSFGSNSFRHSDPNLPSGTEPSFPLGLLAPGGTPRRGARVLRWCALAVLAVAVVAFGPGIVVKVLLLLALAVLVLVGRNLLRHGVPLRHRDE